MPITHAKVSAKSDGSDASLVRPSDWNANHVGGIRIDEVVIAFNAPNIATGATLFSLLSGDRLLSISMFQETAITTVGGTLTISAGGSDIGSLWDLSASGFPIATVGQGQTVAVKGAESLTIYRSSGTWTAGSVRVSLLIAIP